MTLKFALKERIRHGHSCHRAELDLSVRIRRGGVFDTSYVGVQFILDTGADFIVIPVPRAKELGIPFDDTGRALNWRAANGTRHEGFLGEIFVLHESKVNRWPCFFSKLPDQQPLTPTTNPPSDEPIQYRRVPATVGEWAKKQFGDAPDPEELEESKVPPLLLGRAGFLTDYDISISNNTLTVVQSKRGRTGMLERFLRIWGTRKP